MQATLYFTFGILLVWAGSTLSDEAVDLRSLQTRLQHLEKGQAETKRVNEALKTEVQHLHTKNDNLEIEVRQLQQGQPGRDIGRPPTNCVLGSNFLFNEYPDSYGGAIPYSLDNHGNAYRCLDMCRQDPDCVAVSIGKDVPRDCSAYSDVPASILPAPDWDYYQMVYSNSCWIDKPVVEFMTSITSIVCVNDNEMVVWNNVIYDSGDGMKSDGRFHCPVAGYYKLTLDARIYGSSNVILAIRKNDQTELASLNPYTYDSDYIPGTVDVYTFCDVDDTVSVWGEHVSTCLTGGSPTVYSSFSGRLV